MITVPMRVSADSVQIHMGVVANDVNIPLTIGASYQSVTGDWYEGNYTVTPSLSEQEMPTQGKTMRNDVTIAEIPISRVSNPYDGITVLIG